ncbi:MAG: hypothetical protein IPO43_21370 [Rhodoferax sp.]|nr:hypothetical protein [Rhodoferax sp.]
MTELRDARLKRALDHAPDVALRPSEATRLAIKAIACEASAVAVPVPKKAALGESLWRRAARWWGGAPARTSHMPWNAALATVVLASLVTLMWFEQPVPQAVPDDEQARGQATTDTPAPASAPTAVAASEPKSQPLQDASRARSRPERDEPASRQSAQAQPQPQPQPQAKTAGSIGEAKNEPAPPLVAAPSAKRGESRNVVGSVPPNEAVSLSAETTVAPVQSSSPGPSAAPAAAPMPAAPAAAAKAQSVPSELRGVLADKAKRRADLGAAGSSRTPAPPSMADWSDLSVQRAGSPLLLSSAQTSRLVALLQAVSLRATQAGDPEPSASTRLDLSRRGEPVAMIELGERWLRWTPVGTSSGGTWIGRASVAQWEAIHDELERLGLRAP